MYPHERSLVNQLADKPFALIGVNSDSDVKAIKETIKEKNLTWRSFQNQKGIDGVIADEWGIQGWPTLFVIDAEGVIQWTGHSGNFDHVIEKLLGDLGHEVSIEHDFDKQKDGDEDEDDSEDDDEDDEEDDGAEG